MYICIYIYRVLGGSHVDGGVLVIMLRYMYGLSCSHVKSVRVT